MYAPPFFVLGVLGEEVKIPQGTKLLQPVSGARHRGGVPVLLQPFQHVGAQPPALHQWGKQSKQSTEGVLLQIHEPFQHDNAQQSLCHIDKLMII